MLIVGVGHTRHLAVERLVRRARRDCADSASEPRRAELSEQPRVGGVLRQQAVRPAVGERQDRLGAPLVADLGHPRGDGPERLVPTGLPEAALATLALADKRVLQAGVAVDTLAEPTHLAANVPVGDRVLVRAVNRDDSPLLDRHLETAGVGAVEWAHGVDRRPSPLQFIIRVGHETSLVSRPRNPQHEPRGRDISLLRIQPRDAVASGVSPRLPCHTGATPPSVPRGRSRGLRDIGP